MESLRAAWDQRGQAERRAALIGEAGLYIVDGEKDVSTFSNPASTAGAICFPDSERPVGLSPGFSKGTA